MNTILVVRARVADIVPMGADPTAIASGLDDLASALDVVVTDQSNSVLVSGDVAGTRYMKTTRAEADKTALSGLGDGVWTIILRDVRDKVGNFFDVNPLMPGVQPYQWNITVY